jgi:hypothetical protein
MSDDSPIYLKALHPYCFRYGKENPKVIGFVNYQPEGLTNRVCFKVEYESDGTIDYIPYKGIKLREWMIIN